jgi:hypothetical protein
LWVSWATRSPDDPASARVERRRDHLVHRSPALAAVELGGRERGLDRVDSAAAGRAPDLVLAPHRIDAPRRIDRQIVELAAAIVERGRERLAVVAADPDVVPRRHCDHRRVARGRDVLDRLVDARLVGRGWRLGRDGDDDRNDRLL